MFQLVNDGPQQAAVIKVIGVGGGGSNAIDHMVKMNIGEVDFICANTDMQALQRSMGTVKLHIGGNVTKGLGAGANPEIGRRAALEDRDSLISALEGADMVFITAGMGGGTGTGAAPVVAELSKEMGILTVAVVTRPFAFEGSVREKLASAGIQEMGQFVDSLIVIPNQRLLSVLGPDIPLLDAFRAVNDVLFNAVQGIAELITSPGLINVDFADVRTVMAEMGMAMMGSSIGSGEDRARKAAEEAMSSPLLEEVNLAGARGMLVNVTSGPDMCLREFEEVGTAVQECASPNATIVIGTALDPAMTDSIRVTVIATGLSETVQVPKQALVSNNLLKPQPPVKKQQPEAPGDYRGYDRPTVIRRRGQPDEAADQQKAPPMVDTDDDMLDIPAFLRRQAD